MARDEDSDQYQLGLAGTDTLRSTPWQACKGSSSLCNFPPTQVLSSVPLPNHPTVPSSPGSSSELRAKPRKRLSQKSEVKALQNTNYKASLFSYILLLPPSPGNDIPNLTQILLLSLHFKNSLTLSLLLYNGYHSPKPNQRKKIPIHIDPLSTTPLLRIPDLHQHQIKSLPSLLYFHRLRLGKNDGVSAAAAVAVINADPNSPRIDWKLCKGTVAVDFIPCLEGAETYGAP
ncbi:hypothetical protein CMV_022451 [Castanea mollissima]|uniref:Uncharacterized protein n=1 Tax=Castanea mollissima TaxID=60419 RepID=A0A8J4VJN1_9ROSI|nr:hypothetical protein CMV_022451 [Castanea mollissima]